jgi:hypothetical protein
MNTHCLNCQAPLTGKFCSQCGQAAATHRINIHFLWHDIQHGLLHVDKGILFTARELFTRPGNSIREFLEGKRVKHFKPFSLVLILAGVYGGLSHYFDIDMLSQDFQVSGSGAHYSETKEAVSKFSAWLSQHYSILALVQIPILSLGSYLSFRKAGYNFIEHAVINTFLTGQRLILRIIAFPLYDIYNQTPKLLPIDRVVNLIGYVLIFWSFYQLFTVFSKSQRIWRTALSLLISFVILFGLFIGIFEVLMRFIK